MIAQTLLVLKLTDSGIALGVLTACQFLPVLLLGPWAGAVADRADKRRLLTMLQVAAMAQSLALGVAVFSGHATVGVIYALAAVQGVITAFDNPCRRSFVVEMVPPGEVTNAVSLNSAVMTGSRVIGPALAGVLVITVGFGWAFVLDALSYTAVHRRAAGDALERAVPLAADGRRPRARCAPGCATSAAERQLFVPLVMMAIVGTFAFNFSVTIPLLVTGHARRQRRHVHDPVLGPQPRLAGRRAVDGPARRGDQPPARRLGRRLRPGHGRPGGRARAWPSRSRPGSSSGCRASPS